MSQPTYLSGNGYISDNFVTLDFDVALDGTNLPLLGAFAAQVNGANAGVLFVDVDSAAKTVTVYLNIVPLQQGDSIVLSYTDPTAGNDAHAIQGTDGADSDSFSHTMVVTTTPPAPPAPPAPALASGSDTGVVGDNITSRYLPSFTGTALPGHYIYLYEGSTLLGITTSDIHGYWYKLSSAIMSDGAHTLTLAQQDITTDKMSPLSAGLNIVIDTSVNAPAMLALAAGSDSGTPGDGITSNATPTVTGQAEAGAAVQLYDTDNTLRGSATADGAGHWSITSSTLSEGAHTLTAKQTDVAGNVSSASTGYAYQLDTAAPSGLALSATTIDQAHGSNGSTISTLQSSDASAVVYALATGDGVNDVDNGKFTIAGSALVAAQNLSAGTYHLYLSATDAAGNAAHEVVSITVNQAPSISAIVRAGGAAATAAASATSVTYTVTFDQSVTGVDASDFTLTGTGTAAGTISNVSGSGSTYNVTVNGLSGDGNLRLDLKASGTGIQNGSAMAITSGYTAGLAFTLDHTAAAAPSAPAMTAGTDSGSVQGDAITSNITPTFTGTAEANASVALYDSNGTTLLGSANADGAGSWSITSSALSSGSHTLKVTQTDAAGNVSAASGSLAVVIDTSAAAAPGALELASGSDSGTPGDRITYDATPTITGTAEAHALVTLYDTDGVTVLGTATASNSGAWSITSSTLSDAVHTLTATQTDLAGNTSSASAGLALTIDTVAPAAPGAPALAAASDSGTAGDNITNVDTPTVTGLAAANTRVNLYDTNGSTVLGTATADGTGHWSITSSALSTGTHTLTARQLDLAGNASPASAPLALTIQAPPVSPDTIIDGVSVTIESALLPGGGIGTLITIPLISSARVDASGDGIADIPLVSGDGHSLLLAQLPVGFGLTALGGPSQPAGDSLDRLVQSILAVTPEHSGADQGLLTGSGTAFLGQLATTVPLLVETIAPVTNGAPGGPLTLTGVSTAQQHTALVIDAAQAPAGTPLVLNSIDFAAIIGAANITGRTNNQLLAGDNAAQKFTVSAGSGSIVLAGGGNDILALAPASRGASAGRPDNALSTVTTVLHGGAGNDIASFSGKRADYTVESHAGYVVVTANAQPSLHTTVINVENLKFTDATVTLQNSDALAVIDGLYQSILGRQADHLGLALWASQTEHGSSLGQVALNILQSAESQARHAMVVNGDAAHDVELLYQGIFGRHSDAAGLAFWTDKMAHGLTLENVAQCFINSNEMEAHKIGVQDWNFQVSS